MDFFATWNIHDEGDKYSNLEKMANNALERYTRSMNDKFRTPHPSLLVLVQTIELEPREQVERYENICRERIKVPQQQQTNIGPIPF